MAYPISTTVANTGITVKYSDASRQRITYTDGTFNLDSGLNVSDASNLSEKLTVTGAGWFKNSLRVDKGLFLNSTVTATRSSILGDALTVNGSSRLNGPSHLYSSIIIDKKTTFNDALELFKSTTMNSSLIVNNGIANLSSNVTLANASGNALVVHGATNLKNQVRANSSFQVIDFATLNSSLIVSGIANMNNAVAITNSTGNALQVTGTSNFNGAVNMQSSMTVAGASNFTSTFRADNLTSINNSLTIESLHVDGIANLNGITAMGNTLSVSSAVTLNNTLSTSKMVFFNDALDVHKAAHFKSSIIVDGLFNPIGGMVITGGSNGLTIVGGSELNGSATLKSSLEVTDDMFVSSNLTVKGWSHLNSSVVISLDPSLGNALVVNGSTKLNGAADFQSTLGVSSFVNMFSTVNVLGQSNLHHALDVSREVLMKSSLQVEKMAKLKEGIIVSRVSAGDALSVVGSANISSSANLASSLDVVGAVHLLSSLEVENKSVLNSTLHIVHAGGDALTLAGDALYNGDVQLASTFVLNNIANMNSTMTVNKLAQLNKKLIINRLSEGDALSVTAPSYFSSAVVGESSIKVSSNVYFQGILAASEKVSLLNALDVTGSAWMKSSIQVDNQIDLHKVHLTSTTSTFNVAGTSKFMSSVNMYSLEANSTCILSSVTMSNPGYQGIKVNGKSHIENDVSIISGLTVQDGNFTYISGSTIQVKDNAILIADNNTADDISVGIMMQYKPHPTSTIQYAGLRRKAGGNFIFYKDATAQIPNTGSGSDSTSAGVAARVVAASFTCTSDARLKKNVVPLDGALDKIDDFQGVYHDWIDENQPERAIGVIAQDVQKIYPELINEDTDGFLAVNYPKLTAVLLQSVKELKSMVVNVIERRKAAAAQK